VGSLLRATELPVGLTNKASVSSFGSIGPVCSLAGIHVFLHAAAERYYVFLACGNSIVLLFAYFLPACGTTYCVCMRQITWRLASCFIIFLAAPVFALSLVTIASALVWEKGASLHVVIQLSGNSHAFSLHAERHVVSLCNN